MESLEKKVLRIQMIEEELARRYKDMEMRCPVHLSLGQERVAVEICEMLPADSLMVSTHRSHAHYLAKGGSLKRMLAEIYGKTSGCSGGNGGSMHLVDWECGFAGSTSIVGGTIPVGVGLSFADKLRGSNRITAVMLGDAAVEEGTFHEAANFASLHKLNVLFVLEDNDRSCYTRKDERQPERSFEHIAKAHGLFYSESISDPQNLTLPRLLYIPVRSLVEHCGPNLDQAYIPAKRDPEIQKEIDEAFKYARSTD